MSYHLTSRDIQISDATLSAVCRANYGKWHTSQLNLDAHIGNTNGDFVWGSQGFSKGARNVRVTNGGKVLEAELPDGANSYRKAAVDIARKLANVDGTLAVRAEPEGEKGPVVEVEETEGQ